MFDALPDDRAERVRALRERIQGMQRTKLEEPTLPTSAALTDLLPSGGLVPGNGYSVDGSTALALELLREASCTGSWCAIVGMPDLGLEAAAASGIALERLALVPRPADQWLAVVSALIDAAPLVLVQPPPRARISEGAANRIAARLRQREAVLVTIGAWPRAAARLSITDSNWAGIGAGFGHLRSRQVTVSSISPAWQGRSRSRRLWLPEAGGGAAPVAARVALEYARESSPVTPLRAVGRGA